MTELTPPKFVNKFNYQACKQVNDPIKNKRVYVTPDGEKLPSVTTILSSTKDMTHLNEWKKRVGETNADKIVKEAAGIGTKMHESLEKFVTNLDRTPTSNVVHQQAYNMANTIITNGLCDVDEIWAMEQSLYYPGLFSGTTDLVGVYKGVPSIMDYKQTNKPKKAEWISDYMLQLVAYMMAHNEVYKTNIRQGVIFMCSRDLQYQQFMLTEDMYDHYETEWLIKVQKYYNTCQ